MNINFLQWNSRSVRSNKGELEKLLHVEKVDIGLISETWLKENIHFSLSRYNFIRKDRYDGYGGVGILISNRISYQILNTDNVTPDLECVGLSIDTNDAYFNIYCVYKKPQVNINKNQWLHFLQNLKKPFILGGDFNVHNECWGNSFTDRAGVALLDAVHDECLISLNDGSPTRLTAPGFAVSAVDLTFCTSCLAPNLNWRVLDDTMGSDHFVILFSFMFTETQIDPRETNENHYRVWNLKFADWRLYNSEMEKLTNIAVANNDFSYETFISNLNQASSVAIPKFKKKIGPATFRRSWWTEECKTAVANRKIKWNEYKNNPNLDNFIQFKHASAIVKRTIISSKKAAWRSYCTSLNKNTQMKDIWQKIKTIKNYNSTKHYRAPGDWSSKFLDVLAPPYVETNPLITPDEIEQESFLIAPLKYRELDLALKSSNNSAPGLDHIHYSMLFYLPANARQVLLTIFNEVLSNSSPPESWKQHKVIPILKPNKDPAHPTSYRPISLASCVFKTFERIIKTRLFWWLQERDLFPKTQFGFRRFVSTRDAVLTLTADIQMAYSNNQSVVALFLDIAGAYDNVQLNLLVDKIRKIGIPSPIVKLIYALYSNRRICLHINNLATATQTSNRGLAQGTILSPLLYILFTSDLENILPKGINIIQYADDVCLYATDNSIQNCINRLNQALIKVSQWMNKNGLDISYDKTSITTFTRSRMVFPEFITLNNIRIKHSPRVKFLGVHMDSKLTWKNHISEITAKCEKSINVLRVFSSLKWGADPDISLLFYRSCIRSSIDYACLAYGNASDSLLKRLDVIHHKCLRLCVGLLNDTPINALLSEAAEPPLKIRRKRLGVSFLINCYRRSHSLFDKIKTLFILDLTKKFWIARKSPHLVLCYYSIHNRYNELSQSNRKDVTSLPYAAIIKNVPCRYFNCRSDDTNINNSRLDKFINGCYQNFYIMYTDGSSKDDCYGCAWYDIQTNISQSYRLREPMSTYTCELLGILMCLKYLCHNKPAANYLIVSDSKSAIQQLDNLNFGSSVNPIIIDIVQLVNEINSNIHFLWVNGHAGLVGNEKVDVAAKEGCSTGTGLSITSITDFLTSVTKESNLEFKHFFENYGKGLFYQNLQASPCRKTWFNKFNTRSKYFVKTLSRLRTNHGICPKYLHLINEAPTDLCSCGELGTLEHSIMICPIYNVARKKLFDDISIHLALPFCYQSILASNDENVYLLIFKFVYDSKLDI